MTFLIERIALLGRIGGYGERSKRNRFRSKPPIDLASRTTSASSISKTMFQSAIFSKKLHRFCSTEQALIPKAPALMAYNETCMCPATTKQGQIQIFHTFHIICTSHDQPGQNYINGDCPLRFCNLPRPNYEAELVAVPCLEENRTAKNPLS